MTAEPVEEKLSSAEVRTRTGRAAPQLLLRLALIQAMGLLGGIALSRLLGPAPFGAIAVVNAIVSSVSFFGDLGLRAAMIQSLAAIEAAELRAIFTVRLLLAIVVGAIAFLLGPTIERAVWGADVATLVMLPLVLGLVLEPIRSTCTGLLERDVRFGRVATIEVVETAAYYLAALYLSSLGGGVEALAGGVLARALVGTTLGLLLSSWVPRPTLAIGAVRRFLRFGAAWQATQVLLFLNSLVTPLVVGRLLGDAALGLVLWAHGNAGRTMPVFEAISRVALPVYARLEATSEVVRAGISRTVHGGLLVAGLYLALLIGAAEVLVPVLYGPKWVAGIPLLVIYSATFPMVGIAIFLDVGSLARGRATLVRNLHAFKLLIFAGCAFALTPSHGAIGFACASAIGAAALLAAEVVVLRRGGGLSLGLLGDAVVGPASAMIVTIATMRAAIAASPWSAVPTLALAGAVGVATFASVELLLDRRRMGELVRTVIARRPQDA